MPISALVALKSITVKEPRVEPSRFHSPRTEAAVKELRVRFGPFM